MASLQAMPPGMQLEGLTSDDFFNKIATAAIAAASATAHAVIAAAGPQYMNIIQELAQQDDRLRFLACPVAKLVSNVATTTATATAAAAAVVGGPPSLNTSLWAAETHMNGQPGSGGIGSNSPAVDRMGKPIGSVLKSGSLMHSTAWPQDLMQQINPATSTGLRSTTGHPPTPQLRSSPSKVPFVPAPAMGVGPNESGIPLMNQMLALPTSQGALPSLHTSDFFGHQDMPPISLGFSGALAESFHNGAGAPGKVAYSASIPGLQTGSAQAGVPAAEQANASQQQCEQLLNGMAGASAQAQMNAQHMEKEGGEGYGEQGSGGGSGGGNGSGIAGGNRSGGSGSKSAKHSGNRMACLGGGPEVVPEAMPTFPLSVRKFAARQRLLALQPRAVP
jgi:hypothetical protein